MTTPGSSHTGVRVQTYERQTYAIWVCRCPGRFWPEKPRHMTCADCGRLITQIEVGQR